MASLNGTFNANEVAPSAPIEVLPPGKYLAQIVNSEMRNTKNGAGQYLWLEMTILDGQYSNRKLFDRLNLVNGNAQAVEIAQRTLSAICHATGQLVVSDSEQLHHKPVMVAVKVKPAQGEYAAQNEIGGYEAVAGMQGMAAPTQQTTAPRQMAPAAKPAAAAPPWKRSAA